MSQQSIQSDLGPPAEGAPADLGSEAIAGPEADGSGFNGPDAGAADEATTARPTSGTAGQATSGTAAEATSGTAGQATSGTAAGAGADDSGLAGSDPTAPAVGSVDADSANAASDPAASDAAASDSPASASAASDPTGLDDAEGAAADADADADPDAPADALLVREGDVAADYLERLLDILDYDGDIDLDVEGDRAVVAVVGGNLRGLIGPDGATLDAMQELTRLAVAQQTGVRTRLMLDVGGYRARRREELTELGRRTATAVRDSGTKQKMAPMNPFERKVVHDAVATVDGVVSESEGEAPSRCVVVLPQG